MSNIDDVLTAIDKSIGTAQGYKTEDTSKVISAINAGQAQSVQVTTGDSQMIKVQLKDGQSVDGTNMIQAPYASDQFAATLQTELQQDVSTGKLPSYTVKVDKQNAFLGILISLLPFVLIVGVFLLLMNQMQGGGSRVMQFGKSKAKLITKDTPKTTFADVAGADEAIEELEEIKEFLQTPAKFQAIGAKIPKGVLLYGPPGTEIGRAHV